MFNNPYSFSSSDIIVWNGTICTFNSVSHLMDDNDEMRKASDEEMQIYKTKNA